MIDGKAPVLQKSRLPRFLSPIRRHAQAEPPNAHLTRLARPVAAGFERLIHQRWREAQRRQLAADAHRTLTALGMVRDEVLRKACVVDQPPLAQLVDDSPDNRRFEALGQQPRIQFDRGKIAARQQRDRRRPGTPGVGRRGRFERLAAPWDAAATVLRRSFPARHAA